MEFTKRRIKVLHITSLYPSRDYPSLGTFVKSQIDSLRKYVDVELFVIGGLLGSWPYVKAIPNLLMALYFKEFDVIHVHYGNLASLVKILYWGKRPVVTSYCGDDLLGTLRGPGLYTRKSMFFRNLNIFMAHKDAFAIVKSQVLKEQIAFVKKIKIVPNGVDTDLFKEEDKASARKKLGLPTGDKLVLFPADPARPGKNFALIQKALSKDSNKIKTLTFEGNRVKHEDVPVYFNAVDLVVFPSLAEGSPNVIKEAMACNCKIFSSPCGDVSSLLKGVTGSKILSYDVSEWQRQLQAFFFTPSARESNARQALLEKRLDKDSIAKDILEIYYSLLKEQYV